MNKKELFKNLNKLCRDLDNKYNINCGGCCFVAAVIAEQLENCNIPFTVIKYDECGCHYAIKVNDRTINRSDYRSWEIVINDYITSEELYFTYNNNDWNTTYNKRWNLIVKTKIKSLFKKYGNHI